MVDLEIELIECKHKKISDIKQTNIVTYLKISNYAKNIGYLAGDVLRVFKTHNSLSDTVFCVQCGINFNPYKKHGTTCSKSCQSLYMHKTRSTETNYIIKNKLKLINDKKRNSGELSEIAKKAFNTRKNNYTENEIKEQYNKGSFTLSENINIKKLKIQSDLILRIKNILTRKSPIIILRLFYATGGIKIYGNLINELVNLGFTEFDNYRKSRFRYAIKNGLKFLTSCIECGSYCNFTHKFCSYVCHNKNINTRKNRAEKMKILYSIKENKEKLIDIIIKNHAKKTAEERHFIVKKIYSGKTQEWIDNKSRKAIDTRISKKQILPRDVYVTTEYKLYKNTIKRMTKTNSFNLENINLRGKHTYHIDHIYPIVQGFLNNIPPELIADLKNLQMLPAFENQQKNCTVTIIPTHIQEWINANNY